MLCNITQNVLPAMDAADDEDAVIEAYEDAEYSLSLYTDELASHIIMQIEERADDELPNLLAKLLIKHYGRNGPADKDARDIVCLIAKTKVDGGM